MSKYIQVFWIINWIYKVIRDVNCLRALWIKSVLKLSSLDKLVYAYIQFIYALKFNCVL